MAPHLLSLLKPENLVAELKIRGSVQGETIFGFQAFESNLDTPECLLA